MADPTNGRSLRVPAPMVWPAVWIAIATTAGLVTTYVYATKAELSEHAMAEREKRADVEREAATMRVDAAEMRVHVGQHHEALQKLERYVEAVDANLRTLMIESDIPRGRIARPKEE